MSNFLTSSIGKKVIMSLSGLFLISFLCVHLALNLLLFLIIAGPYSIRSSFIGYEPDYQNY